MRQLWTTLKSKRKKINKTTTKTTTTKYRENLAYSVSHLYFRLCIGDSLSIFLSIYVVHIAHCIFAHCLTSLCSICKRLLVLFFATTTTKKIPEKIKCKRDPIHSQRKSKFMEFVSMFDMKLSLIRSRGQKSNRFLLYPFALYVLSWIIMVKWTLHWYLVATYGLTFCTCWKLTLFVISLKLMIRYICNLHSHIIIISICQCTQHQMLQMCNVDICWSYGMHQGHLTTNSIN